MEDRKRAIKLGNRSSRRWMKGNKVATMPRTAIKNRITVENYLSINCKYYSDIIYVKKKKKRKRKGIQRVEKDLKSSLSNVTFQI
jgi:hypothetical protein